MPDALQLLRQQHDEVKEIFKKFSNSDDPKTRKDLAQQAMMQLDVHSKLEEEIFYPAVRAEGDTDSMMNEALEEHHVADLLMDEMRQLPPTDPHFEAKFEVLAESVRHHMEEEESEIFPKASELGQSKLQQLGEEMDQRKPELMMEAQKPRRKTAAARGSTARRPAAARGRTTTRTTTTRGRSTTGARGTRAGSTTRRAAGTRSAAATPSKNGASGGKRSASPRAATRSGGARHATTETRASGTRSSTRPASRGSRAGGTKTGRTPSRSTMTSSRGGTRSTAARSRGASEARRRPSTTPSRGTSTTRR